MATMTDVIRRIQIQASQSGADQTSASLLKLASSQDAVAVATSNTDRATVSVAGKLNALQKSVDTAYRSEMQMATAEKTITAARNEGLISITRENELLTLSAEKYRVAGDSAKAMGESLKTAKEFAMGLVGGLGAGAAFAGIAELPSKIMEAVQQAAGLTHVAETIGITTTQLQALQQAGLGFHVSTDSMDSALERFSKSLALASTGSGQLAKILAANHIIISGDVTKDLDNYANLIQHAKTVEDANLLSTLAFGKSAEEMGLMFRNGAAGIDQATAAAEASGNIMGGSQLQAASDLDAEFVQMKISMDNSFKDFAITTAPLVEAALETITGSVNTLKFAVDQVKFGNLDEIAKLLRGDILGVQTDQMIDQASKLTFKPQGSIPHVTVSGATVIPNTATDNAAKKADDQYRKLIASADDATASLNAQANALGKTVEQTAYLTEKQTLLNQANKDGLTLSPSQLQAIDDEAKAYAKAEAQLQALTELYDTGKQTFEDFASTLKGDLQAGTSLWSSFGDAASKALDDIANKALQMAADGIWDNIFNSAGGSTGGGLIGAAMGLFGLGGGAGTSYGFGAPPFATGGYVSGPGTGTSDSIPARLSAGEFVVKAAAVQANLPALVQMNQGYAGGGFVGANSNGPAVVHNYYITGSRQDGAAIANAIDTYRKRQLAGDVAQVQQYGRVTR